MDSLAMVPEKIRSRSEAVDVHVGSRIREARSKLGMSAANLAQALGVSDSNIENFEEGRHRIGATLLCDLCRVLDQRVSYFFNGYTAPSDADDTDLTIRVSKLVRVFLDMPAEGQEKAYSAIQAMAGTD